VEQREEGRVKRQQWIAVGRVIGIWTIFGVVLALVPILFSGISEWIRGDSVGLSDVIGGGELLLVSAGISAAALGELARQRTDSLRGVRGMLTGVGIVTILLAGLLFADIAGSIRDNEDIDTVRVATISAVIFTISLVTAATAMVVAEVSTWSSST
jgi:hypothetical protein